MFNYNWIYVYMYTKLGVDKEACCVLSDILDIKKTLIWILLDATTIITVIKKSWRVLMVSLERLT